MENFLSLPFNEKFVAFFIIHALGNITPRSASYKKAAIFIGLHLSTCWKVLQRILANEQNLDGLWFNVNEEIYLKSVLGITVLLGSLHKCIYQDFVLWNCDMVWHWWNCQIIKLFQGCAVTSFWAKRRLPEAQITKVLLNKETGIQLLSSNWK